MSPPTPPPKETYATIEARIQSALSSLQNPDSTVSTSSINLAAVARSFNVPVRRLRARWHGQPPKTARPGSNKKLTEQQEMEVFAYLDRLNEIGACVRLKMVTACANGILRRDCSAGERDTEEEEEEDDEDDEEEEEDNATGKPKVVGENWAKRLLWRHKEYPVKNKATMDIAKKNAKDPETFRNWFEKLKKIRVENGVNNRDIYSFDEITFRVAEENEQRIITRKLYRRYGQTHFITATNKELLTVCETISAKGEIIPPMIIVPSELDQENWSTDQPDNYLIAMSKTGSSTDELSMTWLKHFDKFSARRTFGAYRLLLLDSYTSYFTKPFLDYCDERKIIPFCIPPHTSHLLQPLDLLIPSSAISKTPKTTPFLSTLHTLRKSLLKPPQITSAFRRTGLEPLNPSLIISQLLPAPTLPALVPPISPQEPLKTPETAEEFRDLAKRIMLDAEARGVDKAFRERLQAVLREGLVQVVAAREVGAFVEGMRERRRKERERERKRKRREGV